MWRADWAELNVFSSYHHLMCDVSCAHPPGDTASNLGVAMDELMRHQPSLRNVVIAALIRVSTV